MSKKPNPIVKGTFFLTISGVLSRILGFFYRILLSNGIGSEGMGLFQLMSPITSLSNALCTSGIKTSVTKHTASSTTKHQSKQFFTCGLIIALLLSCIISILIYAFARSISTIFLKEPRCCGLLKIIAVCLPIEAIHSITCSYLLGKSNAKFPALLQFIEQLVRVSFIYFTFQHVYANHLEITPSLCLLGLLIGELFSAIICGIYIIKNKLITTKPYLNTHGRQIMSMAIPLSASRVVLHFFHSLETILMPIMLVKCGYSTKEALQLLGIISGMSMPFILFPATITTSYASMLLPKIASLQANKNNKSIASYIETTINFCIAFGIFCTSTFLIFGAPLAARIFGVPEIFYYVQTLSFLCPFLYLDITLGNTLNGLGHTKLVFKQNLISLIVHLCFIIFGTTQLGILSYLLGLLSSEIYIALGYIYHIKKLTGYDSNPSVCILKTILISIIAFGITFFLLSFISTNTISYSIIGIIISSVICVPLLFFTIRKGSADKHNN